MRLVDAVLDLLQPITAVQPFLADWPKAMELRAATSEALPVLLWLSDAAALSTPMTTRLMATLTDVAAQLAWRQSYAAADFGPAFLDRYGWTELVGTSGPIRSDSMACGFLVLGPDVHYPSHSHEAEELYLPLAGTALWQRGDAAPDAVPPGTPIHHPSWMPHAMWTRNEPLVALYCWRGGPLGAKPRILGHG